MQQNTPEKFTCYQCENECKYLFEDGRCYKCTRMSVEEVTGVPV